MIDLSEEWAKHKRSKLGRGRKIYPSGLSRHEVADELSTTVITLWRWEKQPVRHWPHGRLMKYLSVTGKTIEGMSAAEKLQNPQ